MQWDATKNGGFSNAAEIFRRPGSNYGTCNVKKQLSDSGSILNHYRKIIGARNQLQSLQSGDFKPLETNDDAKFFAFIILC